jgi:hypothetical protein
MLLFLTIIILLSVYGTYVQLRDGGVEVTIGTALFATLVELVFVLWVVATLGWTTPVVLYVVFNVVATARIWREAYGSGWFSTPALYVLVSAAINALVYIGLWQHYA